MKILILGAFFPRLFFVVAFFRAAREPPARLERSSQAVGLRLGGARGAYPPPRTPHDVRNSRVRRPRNAGAQPAVHEVGRRLEPGSTRLRASCW